MPRTQNHNAQTTNFATLEARVERVADATIRKKWRKLPSSGHSAARDALSIAKLQARSRRAKGKSTQLVEECIDDIVNRLQDRLPRIPYPPTTDESHFDHEANLTRANRVESQLAENLRSMKLLQAQISKEEQLKMMEETELRTIEDNAKNAETARRTRTQHLHPFAKVVGEGVSDVDVFALTQQTARRDQTGTVTLYEDQNICAVLGQLESHLSSLSQNVTDITTVSRVLQEVRQELSAIVKI